MISNCGICKFSKSWEDAMGGYGHTCRHPRHVTFTVNAYGIHANYPDVEKVNIERACSDFVKTKNPFKLLIG